MTTGQGLPVRGACYGYEVRSELEFGYLRLGGGDALEVSPGAPPERPPGHLLREFVPPLFPTHVRLYSDGDDYRIWIDGGGWFAISPHAPRIVVPPDVEPVRREERIWGLPILLCFLARGDVPLHASCVEIDGRALLLAGPGRFGKTTLAAAFAADGYRVLSEDLVCLRPGPTPSVIPGPAMLRVRRDVVDDFRIPGAAELLRDTDRTHLSLTSKRGTCDPVPIAGIALLSEADTDPRLERVAGPDVVRDLWTVSFKLPTDDDRARCFRAVGALASSVETWSLTRRRRLDDLRPTLECLVDAVAATVDADRTLLLDSAIMERSGTVLRRNPAVTMRELSEGAGVLLLHTTTGAYHRLNWTGAVIWRALVEPTPFEELERRLLSELEGVPAMPADDLAAYIADLAEKDLIHVQRGAVQ